MALLAPPPKILPSQWAEQHRVMPEGSAIEGRFRFGITEYLRDIVDATVDKRVQRVVCRKSAQIGWTDGVVLNSIGYRIDLNPSRQLVLLPRTKAAIEFNSEKLEPMIEGSPRLASKVNLVRRSEGNRQQFKTYPGGFVKLIASGSPGEVKSTSAPVVFVEEPDDCNLNVKGQGDSIKLAEERVKAFHNALIVIGGTPTIKGVSAIDSEIEKSDQRLFHVPCHHCGEAAPLQWENLRWSKDDARPHPVYGKHHPESARYTCPSCGGEWTDAERVRNVRRGKWIPTRQFTGIAGFDGLNELYSPFKGARMPRIVEKYLDAWKAHLRGDDAKLITFWNSSLGRSYEYRSETPALTELQERGEEYAELTVPQGGLVLVLSVDVQGNRLAVTVWAYGRDSETWLVYWGEEYGAPADRTDGVWAWLDEMVDREYPHVSGVALHVKAVSIDSSDGQTNDAVYDWVRSRRSSAAKVMAVKGRSTGEGEIYSAPSSRSIDPGPSGSKASKYGLKVYMVGTEKAKDLILGYTAEGGRIKRSDRLPDGSVRTGRGPGRMHWYADVRPDFLEQLADSEVKVPGPKGKRVYKLKAGRRNEALDCAVYAEHAARSLRLHLATDAVWSSHERALEQAAKLDTAKMQAPAQTVTQGGFPVISAKVN